MASLGRWLVSGVVGGIGLISGLVVMLILALVVGQPPALGTAAPAQGWELTVEISDALLTTRLNTDTADQPIKLQNAKAASHADGTVLITGSLAPAGVLATPPIVIPGLPLNPSALAIPAEIVLRPVARDGKLVIEIVRTQLGPIPIPAQLGRLLEAPLNSQVASATQGQPYSVTEVIVRDGSLAVRVKGTGQ